jgi:hypothetical protein
VLNVDFTALARDEWAWRSCASSATCRTTSPAHPVPPAAARGRGGGPALHAAEGSGRPHGGRAGDVRLRAAVGDAAVALRDGGRAVRAAGILRSAARVDSAVVRMVPRESRPRSTRSCCPSWCRWPSASGARCCATRWASGWRRRASPATSTCSGGPRKCRWRVPGRRWRSGSEKKKPRSAGLSRRGAGMRLGGREPVAGVEGAAHAQRQRRDVDQLVRRHLLAGFGRRGTGCCTGSPWSLVRPFCLACLCRTGYRKE